MGGILACSDLETNVNLLISAALVSESYCELLLSDPARAISQGYRGHVFDFTPDELREIASIRADTLAQFAGEVLEQLLGVVELA